MLLFYLFQIAPSHSTDMLSSVPNDLISSSKEITDSTWGDLEIQVWTISPLYTPNQPPITIKDLNNGVYDTFEHF